MHKKISEMTRSHEDTLVLEIAAESTVMDIEVINLRSVNQPTQQSHNGMLVTTPLTSAYSSAANSAEWVVRPGCDVLRRLRPRHQ